jgi:hypothetical protein
MIKIKQETKLENNNGTSLVSTRSCSGHAVTGLYVVFMMFNMKKPCNG